MHLTLKPLLPLALAQHLNKAVHGAHTLIPQLPPAGSTHTTPAYTLTWGVRCPAGGVWWGGEGRGEAGVWWVGEGRGWGLVVRGGTRLGWGGTRLGCGGVGRDDARLGFCKEGRG
ncbi:hypothetical protein Pcinc_038898 [Petrolisthes cinctipes]|uniref:Uncharacterized protein n=1 Tax=Petrolisthes cinctipes TaxID=88211 RepID=A0AAE1BSJ4_PETCI|nr:hypothetical protein Pcinc_038898 [Petrolisthes cinctipes]